MANDPARDWTYSGDYFARTHGLTVDWIAAYQKREPTTAHRLWQFTDKHEFPGIGDVRRVRVPRHRRRPHRAHQQHTPPAPTPAGRQAGWELPELPKIEPTPPPDPPGG
jgi:hypothetical protein